MILTLGHILYAAFAFVVAFAALALVDVWHMVRFGTYGIRNFFALFVFLAGTAVVLWGASTLLVDVDWTTPLFGGVVFAVPSLP